MTLEDQLRKEILSRYKSIREFSSMIKIPYSTVDSILKRGIKNSGVGTVIKIFSYLDIDVESITSGTLKHIDSSDRIEKSSNTTEAALEDKDEKAVMRLVSELTVDQQEFLVAWLMTTIELRRKRLSSPQEKVGGIAQEPESPIQS